MIFDPITSDETIGNHRWLRRHESGRAGHKSHRKFEYLPRISVSQARRIVDSVRRAPASGPLRDQLMEMIKFGLGVPQDLQRLVELRATDIATDPEKLAALNAYLDGLDASINEMERYMSPWPYLPSAEWVAANIGCEAWPFFPRAKPTGNKVDVPNYAAPGVLIYMQDGTGAKTYTLCDSYVLKRKNGVVAIPSLFAHHQFVDSDVARETSARATEAAEAVTQARARGVGAAELQALVDVQRRAQEAKAKKTYLMRSRIRGKIDVTGVMKSDRKYFALFGLFYFEGRDEQSQLLNKAFKVDIHMSLESDIFGSPNVEKLREVLDSKRARYAEACEYVERYRVRMAGNPPPKLVQSYAKAEAVIAEFDRASRNYHRAAEKPLTDSPLNDLSFYALDVMLPSTFKPTEIEWKPILTPKFARVADRLYGNDKSVNKERTVQFSLTPQGSRIW